MIQDKLEALRLQLNYTCYDSEMLSKLNRVWESFYELETEVKKLQQHGVMQGLPSRKLLDECWRSAFTAFIDCRKTKTDFDSETEFNKYYTELSTKLESSPAVGQRSVDTVAVGRTCDKYCTGPWDCQCQDVLDAFYRKDAGSSHEGQP
jgi:hypothetical protein